jgi:Na+-transporting NADH:ubiquinone oxidoreductase subunit NqrF
MKQLLKDQHGIAAIIVVLIVLGVIVVGVVAAGAVILSNDMAITVNNRSCGTLDIAQGSAALGFNFLPGINVPSQIAQGDIAIVQVPRMFIDSVTIGSGSVEIQAFSRSFTFGTSRIDMQSSTLDGTPLTGLVGHQIDISQDHTLVLECK